MNQIYRTIRIILVSFCILPILSACGNWAVRDYPHPDSVVLQQVVPGQALIYFLRAPHDSGALNIHTNGKQVAKMSPATYVALSLPQGNYSFVTTSSSLFNGTKEAVAPLEIKLKPNERVFNHVSGIAENQASLIGIVRAQGSAAIPLLGRESVVTDRVWNECSELDARV